MARDCLAISIVLLTTLPASAIFYGDDDYVEVDQIDKNDSDIDWAERARSVAIVLDNVGPNGLDLSNARAMRARYRNPPLEAGYKYGPQPRVAQLTAFLVGPDLIMTAGHAGARRLGRAAFVFNYTWDSKNKRLRQSKYGPTEVYRCKKVLLHRNDKLGDYAICQLDKPVKGRTPLTIEALQDTAAIDKQPAKMISAPDGTPLKLTNAGQTLGSRPTDRSPNLNLKHFFFHTLDNSGGSSGAPIFSAKTGRVIGIQSGGDDNFTRKEGVVYATRGDFEKSNLGRPLKGEWGSLIPARAVEIVESR